MAAAIAQPLPAALARWLPEHPDTLAGAGLDWLRARRAAAAERAGALGVPTSKAEGWRYSAPRALLEQEFAPLADVPPLTLGELAPFLIADLAAYRVVLVNGRFVPALSTLADLPPGAHIGGLAERLASDPDALAEHFAVIAGESPHLFGLLNTAASEDGLALLLDPGVVLERPIELLHLVIAGPDTAPLLQPRHLFQLGAGARARVIERYVGGAAARYCTNTVLEIALGAAAALDHVRVQDESPQAFHLAGLFLAQERASRYAGIHCGLGAAWARTDLVARFTGADAACELSGLYLAGDGQLLDYHLDVRHDWPGCRSRELFKGILHGRGKAVFDGRVRVSPQAQQTDAHMTNRNLLLSPNAEIDTKPQLEIFADDVRCSHGTTIGQLEPEQLFYLRSRGIPETAARRMLCIGFASEIIDALEPAPLRAVLAEQIGARLDLAPAVAHPEPEA